MLTRLSNLIAHLMDRVRQLPPHQRKTWLAALAAALIVVMLTSALLAFNVHPAEKPLARAVPTDTSAPATDTATVTPKPTSTHTPRPAPAPAKVSQPLPPPPPPPPPPPSPTVTFCPTPTPFPITTPTVTDTPTATATSTPAMPTSSPSVSTSLSAAPAAGVRLSAAAGSCVPCPYYRGNNPTQSQIATALNNAASAYGVPRNLLYAVAWQESKWHEDVTSCDGGVGLMQVQWYYVDYFNTGLHAASCGIGNTSYDAYDAQGNAYLGAKYLKYLMCYWAFAGGTASSPGLDSSAYYYAQANRAYPDSASADSFCAAVYNNPAHPEYPALPENVSQDYWSCPYTPTTGDSTILDITLSSYNAGPGAISKCGCIPNPAYVTSVEGFVPQFASGALPH